MSKNDTWCSKVTMPDGTVVSGGAARNVRIAAYPKGMDSIIANVGAAVFEQATILAGLTEAQRPHLIIPAQKNTEVSTSAGKQKH